MNKITLCVLLMTFLSYARSQAREGDRCTDTHSNTPGICTPAQSCETARNNYHRFSIIPTFCVYNAFGINLVCCTDNTQLIRPVSPPSNNQFTNANLESSSIGTRQNGQSVSERKCQEYSRSVVETVDFIPLLPEPETHSISSAKCGYTSIELIVGGQDAVQGEFPHMVAIGWLNFQDTYDFKCGGSLISNRYVLTAAHCISDPRARQSAPSIVRLGDQNLNPAVNDGADPIDVRIQRIIPHPQYKAPKKYHDIALFELADDVTFSASIRPACLWTRPDFGSYKKALATGWGVNDTETGKTTDELQKVSLTLLDNGDCGQLLRGSVNRNWGGFIDSQMCAGELRGGKDTCQGDSGSPLQVTTQDNQCIHNIIGITSFGQKCARSGTPAVYTRVSSYVDWIESVVWPGE